MLLNPSQLTSLLRTLQELLEFCSVKVHCSVASPTPDFSSTGAEHSPTCLVVNLQPGISQMLSKYLLESKYKKVPISEIVSRERLYCVIQHFESALFYSVSDSPPW